MIKYEEMFFFSVQVKTVKVSAET